MYCRMNLVVFEKIKIGFVEKFKKTHVENLQGMAKKLKIAKTVTPIIIVGRDCKRENIWRSDLFSQYKANRANGPEDGFMGGPFELAVMFPRGNEDR